MGPFGRASGFLMMYVCVRLGQTTVTWSPFVKLVGDASVVARDVASG
jgi:hypothetical protein